MRKTLSLESCYTCGNRALEKLDNNLSGRIGIQVWTVWWQVGSLHCFALLASTLLFRKQRVSRPNIHIEMFPERNRKMINVTLASWFSFLITPLLTAVSTGSLSSLWHISEACFFHLKTGFLCYLNCQNCPGFFFFLNQHWQYFCGLLRALFVGAELT